VSSLEKILEAVGAFREGDEPIAVMIAGAGRKHAVRVLVGGECITHVEAPTRAEAVANALDDLEDAVSNVQNLRASNAIAAGASW
jgi:hypothetical protein